MTEIQSGARIFDEVIDSPVGFLGVLYDKQKLCRLEFLGKKLAGNILQAKGNNSCTDQLSSALNGYFSDPHSFKQPDTVLSGTVFQKKVWQILSTIKPGQTRTYGDIAQQLNSSARAVGNACRRNPIPIFIPCHRVVSASGRGGFMGQTQGEAMDIKEWLLKHEQEVRREV